MAEDRMEEEKSECISQNQKKSTHPLHTHTHASTQQQRKKKWNNKTSYTNTHKIREEKNWYSFLLSMVFFLFIFIFRSSVQTFYPHSIRQPPHQCRRHLSASSSSPSSQCFLSIQLNRANTQLRRWSISDDNWRNENLLSAFMRFVKNQKSKKKKKKRHRICTNGKWMKNAEIAKSGGYAFLVVYFFSVGNKMPEKRQRKLVFLSPPFNWGIINDVKMALLGKFEITESKLGGLSVDVSRSAFGLINPKLSL